MFLVLLLSGNVYADTKLVDTFKFKHKGDVFYSIYTLCIDGYKFITTQDIDFASGDYRNDQGVSTSTSVNTIQFMIVENGVMLPAKCD